MKFQETPLAGAYRVSIEPHADVRGFFARTWCASEFQMRGLPPQMVQSSISFNAQRGTVRGMHLQLPPSREGKLVSCVRGAIYDVAIDLRPGSATYLRYFGTILSAASHDALYMPPLMAHGFQTLEPGSEVLYQMTDYFAPELGFGLRWNDPLFAIDWPVREDVVILPRDAEYPDFDRREYERRLAAGSRDAASDGFVRR